MNETNMEVLECYRVVRIRATREQWEGARRNQVTQLDNFIRRRLESDKRRERREDKRTSLPTDHLIIEFEERGGDRSIGRSLEFIVDALTREGFDLRWGRNGKPFTPSVPDDGRR